MEGKTLLNESTYLVIERSYNAPVTKIWKAITDKDQMKDWFFEMDEFKAEQGFELRLVGKGDECQKYPILCKVIEVIPFQKMKYRWLYGGYSGNAFATFEMFDQAGKTRLKLTHEGLDTYPATPIFAKEHFIVGWTEKLDALQTYLHE